MDEEKKVENGSPIHECYICGVPLYAETEMWTGKMSDGKSRILCKYCIKSGSIKQKLPYVSINALLQEDMGEWANIRD